MDDLDAAGYYVEDYRTLIHRTRVAAMNRVFADNYALLLDQTFDGAEHGAQAAQRLRLCIERRTEQIQRLVRQLDGMVGIISGVQ